MAGSERRQRISEAVELEADAQVQKLKLEVRGHLPLLVLTTVTVQEVQTERLGQLGEVSRVVQLSNEPVCL